MKTAYFKVITDEKPFNTKIDVSTLLKDNPPTLCFMAYADVKFVPL